MPGFLDFRFGGREPGSPGFAEELGGAGRQSTVSAAMSTQASEQLVRERMGFLGWLRSMAMFKDLGSGHWPRTLKSMTRPSLAPEA
jgi:hypothetical protein